MNVEDYVDRTSKILVDSNRVGSFADAERERDLAVRIVVGDSCVTVASQATALTAVATARRAFGGRVSVELRDPDAPALGAGYRGMSIAHACEFEGAAPDEDHADVEIRIDGATASMCPADVVIWATNDGWTSRVSDERPRASRSANSLVGVATGALAVSEAFHMCLLGHRYAGRRLIQRSLWRPDLVADRAEAQASPVFKLPADVWLVGLGHLGQGFAWSLLQLPGLPEGALRLTLQDDERCVPGNVSTGLLLREAANNERKTRAVCGRLTAAGFDVALVERRMDSSTRRHLGDPAVALFGVDNYDARKCISLHEFRLALDVALGGRPSDFDTMTMRAFPDIGESFDVPAWRRTPVEAPQPSPERYRDLELDACGAVRLAQKAVGASFVGAYAGALAWSELARRCLNGPAFKRLDVALRSDSAAAGGSSQSLDVVRWACTPSISG